MACRLAIEPESVSKRGDIAGFNSAKVLRVHSEIKVFRFHGSMTAEHFFNAATNGISPVKFLFASID
jgi:hypothetical protein